MAAHPDCSGANELQSLAHDDLGRVSFEFLKLSVAAHDRVAVKKVRDRQPGVEAEGSRVVIVAGKNRDPGASQAVEVPFAEMARCVAGLF